MSVLELYLFGPPRVRLDGAELRFDTRKAVAMLAILAVTGREHSRDSLAAMLWPELERTRARATLRRTLSVATAVGPVLEVTASGVGLQSELVWCDVRQVQTLTAAGDAASWARAVDLASGGFLEGFALRDSPVFEDWQIATSEALRDLVSQTLSRLVADAVGRGDLAAALLYARKRVQVEPLSEPAHADLIRVTAWNGDRPGAIKAYRALVRLLDRELGVPPLPETLALHESIRAGSLSAPLSRQEHARPPVTAMTAAPSLAERVVGRESELTRLMTAWRGDGVSSVGLVGDPGMGKTALSRAFAARVAAEGASIIRLAGHAAEQTLALAAANDLLRGMLAVRPDFAHELGDAGQPLGVIASELDSGAAGVIRSLGDLQRVHEAMRSAIGVFTEGRRTLLVIDDADLLDTPSAGLLGYIVRRMPPGLFLLATWTSPTGRAAPLPDAIAAGEIIAVPALDLAGVAALVADSPHSAAEVLRRTRGVPLLVREYAIAREPLGDASPSHARDVVSVRFASASATTRQLVGAAAVIGTVADPELLRVACGRDESETVDAIEEAIAHGLLVERLDRPGYDVPHDLVRDVALSWLSLARGRLLHGRVAELLTRRHGVDPLATPAGAVARHLAAAGRDHDAGGWYLRAADEAARVFAHAEALEQLRAALALGLRTLDVHHAIGSALVRLGRYSDALGSLDRACALAEDDPARQAMIEHSIAGVYDRLGDAALAQAHLEAARDLAAGVGVSDGAGDRLARILADLALVQHRRGDAASAEITAHRAAGIAREHGDTAALAQAGNVLGVLATARGDHATARSQLADAAQRARDAGDLDLLIAALNNLSRAHQAAGDDDEALAAAREALQHAERQGDRHRLAALHSHLADLLHAAGRDDEAVAELKSSASAFADLQDAQSSPEVWALTEW
jgi:DNA-binding SARP family transcriptional activator/tetratricopeptide (TPR) repeat protein